MKERKIGGAPINALKTQQIRYWVPLILGVVLNEIVLGYFLTSDGKIEDTLSRFIILFVQLILIAIGTLELLGHLK